MEAISQISISTNPLFVDILETYGTSLQNMNLKDESWLLRELAWEYWQRCKEVPRPSLAAEELMSRVTELSFEELALLIQALVNRE